MQFSSLRAGLRSYWRTIVFAATAAGALMPSRIAAQPAAEPRTRPYAEIEAGLYVVSAEGTNMIVLCSHDSALVVGPQLPTLVAAAQTLLASRRATRTYFVLVTPTDSAVAYGDGGWGRRGAVVLAHEALRYPMMARYAGGQHRVSVALPAVGFSQVVQLNVGGSDVHVISQRPGSTAADAVVHFENANTVYLGAAFTADGYPALKSGQGGSINAMVETIAFFRRFPATVHFVPDRGPVATLGSLQKYSDMLVTVRDRVQRLIAAGRTEAEVVAAKPTADLDGIWGHGAIRPDAFTAEVYRSLATR